MSSTSDPQPCHHLNRAQQVYLWMSGVFLVSLIVANLMGGMLVPLQMPWGRQVVTAGIFIFPITFLLTDLINEYFGTSGARLVTLLGLGMSLLTFGFFWLGGHLPVLPESPLSQGAFLKVSGQYTGLVFASMVVYLIGQFLDIGVFVLFRRWTGGRLLWLRATGSTLVSQLVDSFLIVILAFSSNLPWPQVMAIAWANYQVKFLVSVGITPVLYGLHAGIRRVLNNTLISIK